MAVLESWHKQARAQGTTERGSNCFDLQPGGRAATLINVRRDKGDLGGLSIGQRFAGCLKDRRRDNGAGQCCLALMSAEGAMITRNILLDRGLIRCRWGMLTEGVRTAMCMRMVAARMVVAAFRVGARSSVVAVRVW